MMIVLLLEKSKFVVDVVEEEIDAEPDVANEFSIVSVILFEGREELLPSRNEETSRVDPETLNTSIVR